MSAPDPEQLLEQAVSVAARAGKAALEFYGRSGAVERKADDSPLTLADKASHNEIIAQLGDISPDIPVLSEESSTMEIAARRSWSTFWLVDPLDGTKEFLKETGQFTVNIALVEGSAPVLGVVHVPVTGVTYYANRNGGAFRVEADGDPEPISTRQADLERLVVVASKDHAGPEVEAFLARLEGAEKTSMGSSLKFCLVAEGRADFYPRIVPTMEWDTGAAQCVLEVAGGGLTDLDGKRLEYNRENLRNPSIVAFGDPSRDWVSIFRGE